MDSQAGVLLSRTFVTFTCFEGNMPIKKKNIS